MEIDLGIWMSKWGKIFWDSSCENEFLAIPNVFIKYHGKPFARNLKTRLFVFKVFRGRFTLNVNLEIIIRFFI